jgi:hypothetical protein
MFWMTATAGLMVGTPVVAMAYLFTTVVIDVGGMDRRSAATATVPPLCRASLAHGGAAPRRLTRAMSERTSHVVALAADL